MAWWEKGLAANSDELSLIPSMVMMEKESIPANPLTFTHSVWHSFTHMRAHPHTEREGCLMRESAYRHTWKMWP